MMALIIQKSQNFRTFILGRTTLTELLYPVGRVNHDLYTLSEGLVLILIRNLGYLGYGLSYHDRFGFIMEFQLTNW